MASIRTKRRSHIEPQGQTAGIIWIPGCRIGIACMLLIADFAVNQALENIGIQSITLAHEPQALDLVFAVGRKRASHIGMELIFGSAKFPGAAIEGGEFIGSIRSLISTSDRKYHLRFRKNHYRSDHRIRRQKSWLVHRCFPTGPQRLNWPAAPG